jgi:hypothetical protein
LRAIKAGRVSAQRDESGAWQIDEAELARVYGDLRSATLQPAQTDALLQLKLEHAEQRIGELTRRAERAERQADELMEQLKRLALPAPSAPHQVAQAAHLPAIVPPQPSPPLSRWRRAWRWMRATG